ncbi:MAG: ribose 5-phosphate isomerase B [Anaerolineaceae bacterium]|nr:ribose 5-phosphate isomerase B [Anaerolineaceae bacterium]
MKLAIGSDHAGFSLKEEIKDYLESRKIAYEDFGTYTTDSCDYPRIAEKVCKAILSGQYERGILVCGTGIGMSIAANKFKGIRAAACSEPYSAIFAMRHNNANVLCVGSRVLGTGLSALVVEGWLNASYEAGRHQRRVDMITRLEQRNSVEPTTHPAGQPAPLTQEDTHPVVINQ